MRKSAQAAFADRFSQTESKREENLAETEIGGRRIAAMHYPELAEPIAIASDTSSYLRRGLSPLADAIRPLPI